MVKNNRKFFIVLFTVVLVIFLAACESSSEESSAAAENQPQNDDSSEANQTDNDSNTNKTDAGAGDTDDKDITDKAAETSNNESTTGKDASANTTAGLKEEYLQKVQDAKNKVQEIRDNPVDDTTIALKQVEGDTYDILDGLLNEIYGVLEKQLPKEEMDQLRSEQRDWIDTRDHTAKEASLKYEGGTMEQYEYVRVENNLTEERCFELVENYM